MFESTVRSIALLACSATPAVATDWLVATDGSGDFTEIAHAVASPTVVNGDRLWVAPGVYTNVATDKALDVLALPGQEFTVEEFRVENARRFTLAGMRGKRLTITGVPGRVLVTRSTIGLSIAFFPDSFFYEGTTRIVDCAQVVLAQCTLHGTSDCYPDFHLGGAEPGLTAIDSHVVLQSARVFGGDDILSFAGCNQHYGGAPAVRIQAGARVEMVGSDAIGGLSPWLPAPAVLLADGHVDVRGLSDHVLQSGNPGSLALEGSGTAFVTGVTLEPPGLPPWVATGAPAPFLLARHGATVGGDSTLDVYGDAGEPAFVFVGAIPIAPLPLAGGQAWLDPTGPMVTLTTTAAGETMPSRVPLHVPALPGLVGTALTAQAWLPLGPHGPTPPAMFVLQ